MTDYANMTDAELIENLRQMAGLNHVGWTTCKAAERLDQMRLALIDSRSAYDDLEMERDRLRALLEWCQGKMGSVALDDELAERMVGL